MDVQGRSRGFAGKFSNALDQSLLHVIGEVVLFAKDDDLALGDCAMLDLSIPSEELAVGSLRTCQGELRQQLICIRRIDQFGQIEMWIFATDDWGDIV